MPKEKRGRGQPRHYDENKEKITIRITPTAIASLDVFATQLNISRSEFVERLARGDGEAIALLTTQKINELIEKYKQTKVCHDVTRHPDAIEFRLDKLSGFLLDRENLAVTNSWGTVEPKQILQAQEWLKVEQELQNLRAYPLPPPV